MGDKKKTDILSSRQARTIVRLTAFTIIILALFLRFHRLGGVPPSLNWDEAALGYNAYSLIKTGGYDEYGEFLPLAFRSFGDYKPPLYTYLTVPSIAVFGLNGFAVRFPSALFGSLTVLLTYFLVKELFCVNSSSEVSLGFSDGGIDNLNLEPRTSNLEPAIAALLLAISPWHLQFSRAAFEANLGLFLAVLGLYLFLKGLKKSVWFLFSSFAFSLSLYAYHSLRVFTPLLLLSLFIIYRKPLWQRKKWIAASFLIGLIFILPLFKDLTQGKTLARFSGISAFSDPAILHRSIKKIEQDNNSFLARIIHNRRIVYAKIFLQNYLSHFDPNFLFVQADQNPRHHAPSNGLLYFWEMISIPAGLFFLSRLKGKGKWVVFSVLLISPIAAAPTQASPHAIRFLNSLPGWIITSSLGLAFLFDKFRAWKQGCTLSFLRKQESILFGVLLTILILGNFIYWSNLYFIHLPLETSQAWQYGYKQAVNEVSKIEKSYNQVIVTGKYDQPYIFFLFYKKYDPAQYQKEFGNPKELSRYERTFGKYHFLEKIELDKIKKEARTLIVAVPEEVGERKDFKTLEKIDFLDGAPAFLIGEKI